MVVCGYCSNNGSCLLLNTLGGQGPSGGSVHAFVAAAARSRSHATTSSTFCLLCLLPSLIPGEPLPRSPLGTPAVKALPAAVTESCLFPGLSFLFGALLKDSNFVTDFYYYVHSSF